MHRSARREKKDQKPNLHQVELFALVARHRLAPVSAGAPAANIYLTNQPGERLRHVTPAPARKGGELRQYDGCAAARMPVGLRLTGSGGLLVAPGFLVF